MKIKNLILSLMVILLVVVSAAGVFAAGRSPLISADILKYEPSPVEPGGLMEVYVSVNNEGTTSEDFSIEFVPEYPFSLAYGEDEVKTLTALPQGENAVLKFRIIVAHDAPNQDMPIKFQYQFGQSLVWTRLESDIAIRTTGAILTVDEYKTIPATIKPGDLVSVEIALKNGGKIAVKDVDVTLDLEDSPFAPIGSGDTKRIASVAAGDIGEVSFDLIADTSAEIKVYSIPVMLSYKDIRNAEYDDERTVSLVMSAQPDLMVVVDSSDVTSPGKAGTVTLKVINKGILDLKYLNTRLVSTDQYEVLSTTNEEYIGNLDSDDFETVEFIIKPVQKDVRLNVVVEFKDPYNKDYSMTYDLPLRMLSSAELGQGRSYLSTLIIVLVVLAVIVYWLYRRRKKKKNKK